MRYKLVISIIGFLALFINLPSRVSASQAYTLGDSNSYNIRFDGAATSDHFSGYGRVVTGDFNGDGLPDIAIPSYLSDNNSRTDSGSVYILFNSLISQYSGKGNSVDMATTSKFNIRLDGEAAAFRLGYSMNIADLDRDGKEDLIIGSADLNNVRGGSVYVFYGSKLSQYTGTGNTVDMATSSNYNIRFDSENTGTDRFAKLPNSNLQDLDGDGRIDLVVGAYRGDYSGRADAGLIYVIYNTVFSSLSGTGNVVALTNTSKYNIKIAGAVANSILTADDNLDLGDFDNDGKADIVVGAAAANSNTGQVFLIKNSYLRTFAGTGNVIDLNSSGSYLIRYDGESSGYYLPTYARIADADADGRNDVLFGTYNGGGDVFILNNALINSYSGTGNTANVTDSSKYTLKITGEDFSSLGTSLNVADINGDGKNDVLMNEYCGNHGTDCTGSSFVISHDIIARYSGTGNRFGLNDVNNYTLRFDGPVDGQYWYTGEYNGLNVADLNGDGTKDLLISADEARYNSRTDSGSLWIIYTNPNSLSVNDSESIVKKNSASYTGSVTAPNSINTISDIQYAASTDDPRSDKWQSCTAVDGRFDTFSESFTCNLTNLPDRNHTIYFRVKDKGGSYTARSRYITKNLTVDTGSPLTSWMTADGKMIGFGLDDVDNIYTTDHWPKFTFTKAGEAAKYQLMLYSRERGEYVYIDDINPNSPAADNLSRDNDDLWIGYDNNQYKISTHGKSSNYRLENGAYKWRVRAIDRAGNITDTAWHLLRIGTFATDFSSGKPFPLTVQKIGERNGLKMQSYAPFNVPKEIFIYTQKPIFYGITNVDSLVTLRIYTKDDLDQDVLIHEQQTVSNDRSRYGINVNKAITPGEYWVRLSVQSRDGDYAEIPEFKLRIQAEAAPSVAPKAKL